MNALDVVKLPSLMELTGGRLEVSIGLIDGPVAMDHPDLSSGNISELPGKESGKCTMANSSACIHGTYVAGILFAKRNSSAPAICPECTLMIRSIFLKEQAVTSEMPNASLDELIKAIVECVEAGARVLNLSVALSHPYSRDERQLKEVMDYATNRGVIIVAAAGNQGTIGGSPITRHPWVIPVACCDLMGRPTNYSNLGRTIGRQGLNAPGDNITSLGVHGQPLTLGGTSAAAPLVTGAIALLWSVFPEATAIDLKLAITQPTVVRRKTVVPPLLDAWAAYQTMVGIYSRH